MHFLVLKICRSRYKTQFKAEEVEKVRKYRKYIHPSIASHGTFGKTKVFAMDRRKQGKQLSRDSGFKPKLENMIDFINLTLCDKKLFSTEQYYNILC